MSEDKTYPKGTVKQASEFSDRVQLKQWVFDTIIESLDSCADKYFKDKGFKKNEFGAGVYGTEKTYGAGVKDGQYTVRYSTKTNSYIDKITTLGTKRIHSIINLDINADTKILNLSYKTTEDGAFRGFQSKENGFMNNLNTSIKIDKSNFKKEIDKLFEVATAKEVAFLTSTKLGVEDKVDKSTASIVETGNDENINKKQMKISEILNSDPEEISRLFEAQDAEFAKKADTKGRKLMFDRSKDVDDLEEGEFKDYFKKTLKKFGVNSVSELKPSDKISFFNMVDQDWESEEETLDEITSAGPSGGVAGQPMGTAGNFGYLAPAAFKKGKNDAFFNTPYMQNKQKKPTVKKSKNENDTFWTTVELNPGSGYIPKGMEHNYVAGMHESEDKYSMDLTKRKFVTNEENYHNGVNKRYIITPKLNEQQEKDKFKKLALFESKISINECSCEDSEGVSTDEYEDEFNAEFQERNMDIEDGEEILGKKIVVVQTPGDDVEHKFIEDDYLNESRMYLHDFTTGNFVVNPNYKGGGPVSTKRDIQEIERRKPNYSFTSSADLEEKKNKETRVKNKFPWEV